MGGDFENVDLSGECGSINIHTLYQQNSFSLLINYKTSGDSEMNGSLTKGGVSWVNGFINRHSLSKCN